MSNQPRRRGPMGGGHGRMGTGEKAKLACGSDSCLLFS